MTAVCPGPVDTPFFDIAEKTGSRLAVKKLTLVRADQVVERAIQDSYHKRERSVYGIIPQQKYRNRNQKIYCCANNYSFSLIKGISKLSFFLPLCFHLLSPAL